METNIKNNPVVRQVIEEDITYIVYLLLLAVVHLRHLAAPGRNRTFFNHVIGRGQMKNAGGTGSVSENYAG